MTNDEFRQWESDVFGYGYGTGERPVLDALKTFFATCQKNGKQYDYDALEQRLGVTVAWLLINILCHADIIDYGTSPRYGWLQPKGKELQQIFRDKTVDELCEILTAPFRESPSPKSESPHELVQEGEK